MLRFLGKTTASIAVSGGASPTESFGAVDEGLTAWELVNASQSDDEDIYSFDSDDVISDGGGSASDSDVAIGDEPELNPVQEVDVDVDCIISIQTLSVSPPTSFPVEMTRNYVQSDYAEGHEDDLRDGDGDDDDDDDDNRYDYDVDDELVPWKLKDRYGKQRIKKMGKRGGPKLGKSKKLPYYDNRPGFSYGKFRG